MLATELYLISEIGLAYTLKKKPDKFSDVNAGIQFLVLCGLLEDGKQTIKLGKLTILFSLCSILWQIFIWDVWCDMHCVRMYSKEG